jgi:hypothetical protein
MDKPNFKQIAVPLIERGLKVVPLRGKSPDFLGKGWPALASSDLSKIDEWAELFPDANCGVVTTDDYFSIDVDDVNWFMEATSNAGLPTWETLKVLTGSGSGMHIYVKGQRPAWMKAVKNPKYVSDALTPEEKPALLEFKQQVVGPGSVHPDTGKLYKILNGAPLTEMPKACVEWFQTLRTAKPGAGVLKSARLKSGLGLREILDGTELAGKYSVSETTDKVFFNYHAKFGRCLVKGSSHRETSNNEHCGFFCMKADPSDWGHFCQGAGCQAVEGGQRKAAMSALGVELKDVVTPKWHGVFNSKSDFEAAGDLKPVVVGFINKNEVNGYAALQKHGKSWVLMSLMKAFLTGADHWFEYQIPQSGREEFSRIVYFVAEVGLSSVMDRLKKMGLAGYLDTTLFIRTSALGVPDLEDRLVMEACEGADVFLDTLIRFLDGPENNAETIKAFATKVFCIKDLARTCHIACHTQKMFQNAEHMDPSMFRGSGDVTAFLTNGWGLKQTDSTSNRIFVKGLFGRDLNVDDEQFVVEGRPWINDTGDFKLIEDSGTLKEELKKISGRECIPKNLTPEELDIVKSGLSKRAAADAINELRKSRNDMTTVSPSSVRRWREGLKDVGKKTESEQTNQEEIPWRG